MIRPRPKSAAILALLLMLSACGQHQKIQSDLDAYADRLQSFTDIEPPKKQAIISIRAPDKQTLKQEISQVTINLREFYAFNECALNQVIAQRNTALGKMQLPSSRFIYEQALIQEFLSCETLLKDQLKTARQIENPSNTDIQAINTLIGKLETWRTQKQEQLPSVWANFITQSDEIHLSLTQSPDFIAAQPSDNFQASRQAWSFIANSKDAETIDAQTLEEHLRELNNSRLVARMFNTQNLIKSELDSLSPLLEQYLETNTCQTKQQEKDIAIMRNIFTLLLSQLTSYPAIPASYSQYLLLNYDTRHQEYRQSMQTHIELWQQIFARCNS
jgi:hypothetical protein